VCDSTVCGANEEEDTHGWQEGKRSGLWTLEMWCVRMMCPNNENRSPNLTGLCMLMLRRVVYLLRSRPRMRQPATSHTHTQHSTSQATTHTHCDCVCHCVATAGWLPGVSKAYDTTLFWRGRGGLECNFFFFRYSSYYSIAFFWCFPLLNFVNIFFR